MNVPHQPPHPGDALAALVHDMEHELGKGLDREAEQHRITEQIRASAARPAGIRPPGVAVAGAGGREWGPSNQRATTAYAAIASPLAVLQHAADRAIALHGEVEGLLRSLTGEERQRPLGPRPVQPVSLLPAISGLATEIEGALQEISRLVEHMKARLG